MAQLKWIATDSMGGRHMTASRVFGYSLIATLLMGVAQAAENDKPWAFQTPRRGKPPAVKNLAWVRNPIDAFILARLEEEKLTPAPEADRRAIVRRLSFDLLGLPPTPEDVERALNDKSDEWYERLVDRLLSSPHYGERWATFWLDLVRFAETDGFKADGLRPDAWRYRDYVIRSLNSDKPYDRFIREQLAGDELYPNDPDALVATGFLRHYPDEFNAVNLEQRRQEILNDMTDTTGLVFLGLTLGCARCHDHKYDPLSQEDYYRLQAFFAAFQPAEIEMLSAAERERRRQQLEQWQAQTAELRKRMDALEEPYRKTMTAKRMSRFPKEYQDMYEKAGDQRSPLEQQIAFMVSKQVDMQGDELAKSMKPEARKEWQELAKQMTAHGIKPTAMPGAMAMTDVAASAPPTFMLRRGDWQHRDKEVTPGFLSILGEKSPAISPKPRSTGRRSVLADWLTSRDNPLTARVMVNRLWQHHFGHGIVGTPSDFGNQGEQATHPELLDWLASEFMSPETGRQGKTPWSLKAMHKLMVMSATYRQSCRWDEAGAKADPENQLLWRMNRRRLEGEAVRDTLLAVSGRLNPTVGGPSVYPELPTEMGNAWTVSKDPADHNRRSVYIFAKRNLRYPLLSAFDAPDSNETCSRRNVSTNAPQALMLLNSKLTLEMARAFAGRVLPISDRSHLVDQVYRLALSRPPSADELKSSLQFLDRQAELLKARNNGDPAFAAAVADLCHVLMNVNEFIYVD